MFNRCAVISWSWHQAEMHHCKITWAIAEMPAYTSKCKIPLTIAFLTFYFAPCTTDPPMALWPWPWLHSPGESSPPSLFITDYWLESKMPSRVSWTTCLLFFFVCGWPRIILFIQWKDRCSQERCQHELFNIRSNSARLRRKWVVMDAS